MSLRDYLINEIVLGDDMAGMPGLRSFWPPAEDDTVEASTDDDDDDDDDE